MAAAADGSAAPDASTANTALSAARADAAVVARVPEVGAAADAGVDTDLVADADERAADARAGTTASSKIARSTLTLASRPRAVAYVEGRRIGQTPVRVTVEPGRRLQVVLLAAGRQLYRHWVQSKGGKTVRLAVRLKRARYRRFRGRRRGILRVQCLASDQRRILLNGRDTGLSCPVAKLVLRPGRYRVGFERIDTGEIKSVRVRIRSRRTRRLRLTRQ